MRWFAPWHGSPAIRINLLVPGTTDTPFTRAILGHLDRIAQSLPMQSVVQPEELARIAAFASQMASCI